VRKVDGEILEAREQLRAAERVAEQATEKLRARARDLEDMEEEKACAQASSTRWISSVMLFSPSEKSPSVEGENLI
jgi:hypothetical protein